MLILQKLACSKKHHAPKSFIMSVTIQIDANLLKFRAGKCSTVTVYSDQAKYEPLHIPSIFENLPGSQLVQLEFPPREVFPGSHASHVFAPSGKNFPGIQPPKNEVDELEKEMDGTSIL